MRCLGLQQECSYAKRQFPTFFAKLSDQAHPEIKSAYIGNERSARRGAKGVEATCIE